jgi:hypothetical protein
MSNNQTKKHNAEVFNRKKAELELREYNRIPNRIKRFFSYFSTNF